LVHDRLRLKRETGALAPERQRNPRYGKLSDVKEWVQRRIAEWPDLTIDDPTSELREELGLGAVGCRTSLAGRTFASQAGPVARERARPHVLLTAPGLAHASGLIAGRRASLNALQDGQEGRTFGDLRRYRSF